MADAQPAVRAPRPARAWFVTGALLALAAVGMQWVDAEPLRGAQLGIGALIAAGYLCTELWTLPVRRGHTTQHYSLADIPIAVGLLVATAPVVLIARALGQVAALGVLRRQPKEKLFFNLAMGAAEIVSAELVYRALLDRIDGPVSMSLALFGGVLAGMIVGCVSLTLVISAVDGRLDLGLLAPALRTGFASALAGTSLALVVIGALRADAWLLAPLLLLTGIGVLAVRAQAESEERRIGLERASGFTSTLRSEVWALSDLPQLLEDARGVMGVGLVELVLDGDKGWRGAVGEMPDDLEGGSLVAAIAPSEDEPTLIPAARLGAGQSSFTQRTGLRDALCVPLPRGAVVTGMLVFAQRPSSRETFAETDVITAEGVAAQLAIAVANASLAEELRAKAQLSAELARKDGLTGLPNRVALLEALASADDGTSDTPADASTPHCVLLIDLNGFKQVNDTFGHAAGDSVLCTVADRLMATADSDVMVSRLGGDEFAVLVPGDRPRGEQTAHRMWQAITRRVEIDGERARVGASIGVAHSSEMEAAAGNILQLADERMYAAKRTGGGVLSGVPSVERSSLSSEAS